MRQKVSSPLNLCKVCNGCLTVAQPKIKEMQYSYELLDVLNYLR